MADEVWKPIAGWPNYEVSDLGRVRSLPRERARGGILKPQRDSGGYQKVALSRPGQVRRFRVHKLVAEAFIGPCPPGEEARHLNDVKDDNRAANLAYGTRRDNGRDAVENGVHRRPRRVRGAQVPAGPRTHCRRGLHELTPENTHVAGDGRRRCRACIAAKSREHYRRKWAA